MEYKTIEEAFKNRYPSGVFKEYKDVILQSMQKRVGKNFEVVSVDQLEIGEYANKGYGEDFDGKCYYGTRLDIKVKSLDSKKSKSIIFFITPFVCTAHGVRKEFSDMGKVDAVITTELRKNMTAKYGKLYTKRLAIYEQDVKAVREASKGL